MKTSFILLTIAFVSVACHSTTRNLGSYTLVCSFGFNPNGQPDSNKPGYENLWPQKMEVD